MPDPASNSSLQNALRQAGPVLCAELAVSEDEQLSGYLERARELGGAFDAVLPGPGLELSPLVIAESLLQLGIAPLIRLAGNGRNRIAHHSDLIGLRALGATSLLLQPGDEQLAIAAELNESDFADSDSQLLSAIETGLDCDPDTLRNCPAQLLLAGPVNEAETLSAYAAELVEHQLTWKFAVLAVVEVPEPSAASELDACAEMLRNCRDIPGISGFVLRFSDASAAHPLLQKSGLRD